MSSLDTPSRARVAAIVVAYRPDAARLAHLLAALASQVDSLYLVDNADDDGMHRQIAAAVGATGAITIPMGGNRGIAAAQNRGLAAAIADQHSYALLCDDDSLPPSDLVEHLLACLAQSAMADVAAVGPIVCDARDRAAVLVFRHTWLGPRRRPGVETLKESIEVPFLIASGCLIRLSALATAGNLREDLFIDHVDLEWCLRVRRAGWRLRVVPGVQLAHRLGDRLIRLPLLSNRPIHVHPPVRNYYLVRNTLALLRSGLLPIGWRLGYVLWLCRYMAFNLALVPPRGLRLKRIAKGLWHGLINRGGPE